MVSTVHCELCVQVCLAALHPVAGGAAKITLAQTPTLHSSSTSSAFPLMHVDAAVSQSFTDEHGAGAAAVYAQYGSGRVADVTTNQHMTVVSLDESLVSVKGFSGDWFNLEVCIQTAVFSSSV